MCNTEPILRELSVNEAGALRDFYNGLSDETLRVFRPFSWTVSIDQCETVTRGIARGYRYDLVLESDGRIKGWGYLEGLNREKGHLGIGFREEFTDKGYGTEMMKMLIRAAERNHLKAIVLTFVEDNARARHVYLKLGFCVVGEFTGEDGLKYQKMVLDLKDPSLPGAGGQECRQ